METTRVLEKRAVEGDDDALFRLGYRLAFGRRRSKPEDWALIFRLWRAAAELENRRACYLVGVSYAQGQGVRRSLQRAVEWFRKGARLGYPAAQSNLGYCYRDGKGVPQSGAKAVE